MTQQEAYKILGITEEEIEAAGAVPERVRKRPKALTMRFRILTDRQLSA